MIRRERIRKLSNKEKILFKALVILAITGNIAYGKNLDATETDSNGNYIVEQNDNLHLGKDDKEGTIHTNGDGKDHNYKFNENVVVDGTGFGGHWSDDPIVTNKGKDNINISLAENKVLTIKSLTRNGLSFSSKDEKDRKTLNINDANNKHGDILILNTAKRTGDGSYKGTGLSITSADANIYANNLSFKGEDSSGISMSIHGSNTNIDLNGNFYSNAHSTLSVSDSKLNIKTGKDFIVNSTYVTEAIGHRDFQLGEGVEVSINAKNNINISSHHTIFHSYSSLTGKNSKMDLNAKNIFLKTISDYYAGNALFHIGNMDSTLNAEENIVLEGVKGSSSYIDYNSNLNLNSKNLYMTGTIFYLYNKSKMNLNIKENIVAKDLTLQSRENSEIKIKSNIAEFKNSMFRTYEGGKISFESDKNIITFSNPTNKYTHFNRIESNEKGDVSFTSNKNIIEARIKATDGGKVNINFDGNFDGNQKSSLLGITQLRDDYGGPKGDGEINLGFSNGAIWNIFGNEKIYYDHELNPFTRLTLAEVSNLTLDRGIINFNYENKDRNIKEVAYDLVVDNLKGNNGTFIIGASGEDINHESDPYKKKTDFIEIKKAEGQQTHYIQIADNSIDNIKNHDFEEGKKAIWIADADKNVNFEGKAFESLSNIYDYTVILDKNLVFDDRNNTSENGNNWYITNVDRSKNEVGNSVNRDLSFLYEAAISRLEVDSIHERLGEVRNYDKPHGVWFRTTAGDIKSEDFKNKYNLIQVGYDKQNNVKNGRTFTGFAFNQRKNKLSFDSGDGNSENLGFTVYKSYVADNGLYVDALAKTTYIDTDYKISNDKETMKADYDTWAETLSLEIGKKYSSKEDNSFIIPHLQLNYSFIKGEDYTTNTDIKVKQNDINSLIGKVGIYAGLDLEKSTHYIKIARLYEFKGDYGMTLADKHDSYSEKTSGEESWTEMGIGGTFQVGKIGDIHMYYSLDRTFGSRYEKQWEGTVGVRITF